MKPYLLESFTNEFGQEIKPGDRCLVVTEGRRHRIKVYKGVFLGIRRGPGREQTTTCVRVTYEKSGWVDKDGKPCARWKYPSAGSYGKWTVERNASYTANRIYPLP